MSQSGLAAAEQMSSQEVGAHMPRTIWVLDIDAMSSGQIMKRISSCTTPVSVPDIARWMR